MIIDYKKHFGNDGTVYNQTIKIDKWLAEEFNIYLMNLKQEADQCYYKDHCYTALQLKIKSIDYLEKGTNYTNLIHLDVFTHLLENLNKKGYNFDTKRILDRNTLFVVI